MKLSKVAAAVAALLATDAKPTEAQIIAAVIAADKKGKDEGGLGPVEIENKGKDGKGKDEFPPKKEDKDAKDRKGKDEKDDPEHTNDEKDDEDKDGAKDEEIDGMDDVQPAKTANGNAGAGGKEPAKDKKGMDAASVAALIAANDAKHEAARVVEPIIGAVTFDSAEAYYKAALDKLGVDTNGVHASAFPTLLRLAKDKADAQAPAIVTDAARVTGMAGAIKGYDRLK